MRGSSRSVAVRTPGLLVVRHGYLVMEKYAGRAARNANPDMASTGKAYTSIACGIMLKEFHDKIPEGLSTKVFTEKYLPEALPLDDPRKAEITLAHLLCMSAGYHGEGQSPGVTTAHFSRGVCSRSVCVAKVGPLFFANQ
jgi:CubicO group peptidase (beta-lactamase class C family)